MVRQLSDEDFLEYCDTHSKIENCSFTRSELDRLMRMAGRKTFIPLPISTKIDSESMNEFFNEIKNGIEPINIDDKVKVLVGQYRGVIGKVNTKFNDEMMQVYTNVNYKNVLFSISTHYVRKVK